MTDADDDKTLNQQIIESLNQLVALGFVEVIGIDESGQWLYKATEEGKKFAKENRMFSKDEGIDGFN